MSVEGYVMAYEETTQDAVLKVKIISKSEDSVIVKHVKTGELEKIAVEDFLPLDTLAENGIPDLSDLTSFNEAVLLINLQSRYQRQEIFTNQGSSLIVINPYSALKGLQRQDSLKKHIRSQVRSKEPHIFNTVKKVWFEMTEKNSNQIIVISGESGSGKTETFNQCVKYLTSAGCNNSDIESKILSASMILDTFGNARTQRNDNASRYGKFFKLHYEGSKISGGKIETYLIEKSRISSLHESESNFHIFYMLLRFVDINTLKQLHLTQGSKADFKQFTYLKASKESNFISQENFNTLVQGLIMNNFTKQEILVIWQVLAGILLIGNIEFIIAELGDCEISAASLHHVQNASKVLGISCESLMSALLTPPASRSSAEAFKNTFAAFLYETLFKYLVKRINFSLSSESDAFIGIVDVFGFSNQPKNGFFQFCINYSSEKLHQQIIESCFKEEEEDLRKEGFEKYGSKAQFVDNEPLVEILEGKPDGVLRILEAACAESSGVQGLFNQMLATHSDNEYLEIKHNEDYLFSVHHTAGQVSYSLLDFISSNSLIDESVIDLLSSSTHDLLNSSDSSKSKLPSEIFRKRLSQLIEDISDSNIHYIKCLLPNLQQQTFQFNQRKILSQIQYLGLLDHNVAYNNGFPIRLGYERFYTYFECLSLMKTPVSNKDWRKRSASLVSPFSNTKGILLGKHMIFMKKDIFNTLDASRFEKTNQPTISATKIQRWFRARRAYWNFRKVIYCATRIQATWRGKQQRSKFQKIIRSVLKIQSWYKNLLYKDQVALKEFGLQVFYQYLKIKIEDLFLEKCFRLAITAQKIWRGHRVRRLLKGKRLIIELFNRKIFRPSWKLIMHQSKVNATILIQSHIRGFLCRKSTTSQITSQITQNKNYRMAVKLQRWLKGVTVRRKISKIRSAALKIQSFFRFHKARSHYLKILNSVAIIQSKVRAFLIRSKKISQRLNEFLLKEEALLKNLTTLEHSELFSAPSVELNRNMQEALKTLSSITEGSASLSHSNFVSSGSLAIQSRQVSPFHLEKLYFFLRPFDFELLADDSVVYEPLWSKQFEGLNKDLLSKEEQILDIALGNCHTLALTSKGRVFVWGWNDKNQCLTSGNKPRLLDCSKDLKISQISCGDDHSLLLSSTGEVFSFGDNSKGQLGTGHYSESKSLNLLPIGQCRQVVAVGNQNMAVSTSGELFLWPFETIHGEKRSFPMTMLSNHTVQQVSVGYNFAMILATSGLLFSLGSNNLNGQLGHGDTSPRNSPTLLLSFKKIGEKVADVACGFGHVIARSTLGKIFTWGSGGSGQLGHGGLSNETSPKLVQFKTERTKPIQICAGYQTSLIMMENRKILSCGRGNMINSLWFTEINLVSRLPELFKVNGEFAVVKVGSVWSKLVAAMNVMVVDLRYLQGSQWSGSKVQSALNMIAAKWIYKSIEPPYIENVAGLYPASLCKAKGSKSPTKPMRAARVPFEEVKERVAEILRKPNDKWTNDEKAMMENVAKLH